MFRQKWVIKCKSKLFGKETTQKLNTPLWKYENGGLKNVDTFSVISLQCSVYCVKVLYDDYHIPVRYYFVTLLLLVSGKFPLKLQYFN